MSADGNANADAPIGSPYDLGPEAWDDFVALGQRRRYEAGGNIFLEGDTPGPVFGVASGRVRITARATDGEEATLVVRHPRQLFGELSAIDGLPRSATATAIEPVDVIAVPAVDFNSYLRDHAELALPLMRMLAERLRATTRGHLSHRPGDLVTRVAARIAMLAERSGAAATGTIVSLTVSQGDLAAWADSDREAISRALLRLRARGWIDVADGRLDVLNLPALRRLADDLHWSAEAIGTS
jgi:CRP-like cAMP-binding protein